MRTEVYFLFFNSVFLWLSGFDKKVSTLTLMNHSQVYFKLNLREPYNITFQKTSSSIYLIQYMTGDGGVCGSVVKGVSFIQCYWKKSRLLVVYLIFYLVLLAADTVSQRYQVYGLYYACTKRMGEGRLIAIIFALKFLVQNYFVVRNYSKNLGYIYFLSAYSWFYVSIVWLVLLFLSF